MGMVIVIIFVAMMVISMVASPSENYAGENNNYDEMKLQNYADTRYAEEFGDLGAYEDNLLIVFLTAEDYYDYAYIAWAGDHIDTEISYLFGNNDTELGAAMDQCINATNYKYSLDSDLAAVIRAMTDQVKELGLDSSFYCSESHPQQVARMVNYSDVDLTQSTVDDALEAFADATGISIVIVVDDMEDVFTKTVTSGNIAATSLVIVLVVLAVVLIVLAVKRKNRTNNTTEQEEYNKKYQDFDQY